MEDIYSRWFGQRKSSNDVSPSDLFIPSGRPTRIDHNYDRTVAGEFRQTSNEQKPLPVSAPQ